MLLGVIGVLVLPERAHLGAVSCVILGLSGVRSGRWSAGSYAGGRLVRCGLLLSRVVCCGVFLSAVPLVSDARRLLP